jgi:hypothetical protein
VSGLSVKFCASSTLPVRSGWAVSAPVSRTATSTPVPSYLLHPTAECGHGALLQGLPQLRELVRAGGDGGAADAGQRTDGAGGRERAGTAAVVVLDDERQRGRAAVPVAGQLLDVEQVGVQDARAHLRDRVLGQYPDAAVGLEGVEPHPLPAGRR